MRIILFVIHIIYRYGGYICTWTHRISQLRVNTHYHNIVLLYRQSRIEI